MIADHDLYGVIVFFMVIKRVFIDLLVGEPLVVEWCGKWFVGHLDSFIAFALKELLVVIHQFLRMNQVLIDQISNEEDCQQYAYHQKIYC